MLRHRVFVLRLDKSMSDRDRAQFIPPDAAEKDLVKKRFPTSVLVAVLRATQVCVIDCDLLREIAGNSNVTNLWQFGLSACRANALLTVG